MSLIVREGTFHISILLSPLQEKVPVVTELSINLTNDYRLLGHESTFWLKDKALAAQSVRPSTTVGFHY